jgi:phenylacetate-CoA ligase
MRQEIEARWNLNAVDIYGLSEVMGPGVAQECVETKDGATIWEDHFYPEIIDPDSGAVLSDGEPGELVFTTLTKEGMPVIRYRTRDLTALLAPTARPGMRRMARITGRSDDMLIIRGVNVFPTQIEEIILAEPALAPQFRLIVDRNGHLDTLEVQCEGRQPDSQQLAPALIHQIKQSTGITATVQIFAPNSIERAEGGKAIRVIDKRK